MTNQSSCNSTGQCQAPKTRTGKPDSGYRHMLSGKTPITQASTPASPAMLTTTMRPSPIKSSWTTSSTQSPCPWVTLISREWAMSVQIRLLKIFSFSQSMRQTRVQHTKQISRKEEKVLRNVEQLPLSMKKKMERLSIKPLMIFTGRSLRAQGLTLRQATGFGSSKLLHSPSMQGVCISSTLHQIILRSRRTSLET